MSEPTKDWNDPSPDPVDPAGVARVVSIALFVFPLVFGFGLFYYAGSEHGDVTSTWANISGAVCGLAAPLWLWGAHRARRWPRQAIAIYVAAGALMTAPVTAGYAGYVAFGGLSLLFAALCGLAARTARA
jgi:hypothetical protein